MILQVYGGSKTRPKPQDRRSFARLMLLHFFPPLKRAGVAGSRARALGVDGLPRYEKCKTTAKVYAYEFLDSDMENLLEVDELAAPNEVPIKYVAFCDILGFSNRVANDFDGTLSLYRALADDIDQKEGDSDVAVTMYSDAILLTANELPPLLSAVQLLWFHALTKDFMLRGGIAKGRYWEEQRRQNLFVVSDALIRAVKLEQMISVPAVVLADDVAVPDEYWLWRYQPNGLDGQATPFGTPLLHFRDRNIVNPFNIMWGSSAANRCRQLMDASPQHQDKYLWFLALYDACWNGETLIPRNVHDDFVSKGIIVYR